MNSFIFRAKEKARKHYILPVYSLAFIGLMSCQGSVSQIKDVQQQKRVDSKVYLKGKVANQAPFLEGGAYELQDNTGSIWVVTSRPLPNAGEERSIQGRLKYESIPVEGNELGEFFVLEEQQLENLWAINLWR